MKLFKIFMISGLIVALGACQTLQGRGEKETAGGVVGAVLGGYLGSKVGGGSGQLWATGAGALLGTLVGSEVGRSLDNADRAALARANEKAEDAPIGETITWNNPDSGNYGSVTPVRDGTAASGAYCREYQQEIVVGGMREVGYGTACRQEDGTWKIVN